MKAKRRKQEEIEKQKIEEQAKRQQVCVDMCLVSMTIGLVLCVDN